MPFLRLGNHRVTATFTEYGEEIGISFGFNEPIKDEIKMMCETPRWNGAKKEWCVKNSPRSRFALEFLQGRNPYAPWDTVIKDFVAYREKMYAHQRAMAAFCLARKRCILAAEMGTGKTLTSIEVIEQSGFKNWWYVAPKSALVSVKVDYMKWGARVYPKFMTYDEMVKIIQGQISCPHGVIFDESSRLKSPDAKRSKGAMHLANAIREIDGYVILMSGSPAPKSPLDWWMQCEIVQPGFLREGSYNKFMDRMAVVKRVEGQNSGVTYPKILTFKDDVLKCRICGKLKAHDIHSTDPFDHIVAKGADDLHEFKPCENEVEKLYKRMNGLVMVVMKKDCLDLPEKVYRRIDLEPTKYIKQLAKMIVKRERSAAQALIQLRALSDGFQYHEKLIGTVKCEYCNGTKVYQDMPCPHCSAQGSIKQYETEAIEVETPKVEALKDILDEKAEDGRLIVYAGFTASIDKVCNTATEAGWKIIRVDGRGWHSPLGKTPESLIQMFQDRSVDEKICFIGHPGSAGMGLTLTASDTIVYYSNDFNAESRIQSEDRIHRPGSRGANIIDLCHLPVDKLVLENLKAKRDLQSITLGELKEVDDSE